MNHTELAIVAALFDRSLYGTELARRVSEVSRGTVRLPLGGLYATLHRIEQKGLIRSSWGDETHGGARRRYYKITAAGHKSLSAIQRMLDETLG